MGASTLTNSLEFHSDKAFQHALLKNQHPVSGFRISFHCAQERRAVGINCFAFGQHARRKGSDRDPELRVVLMFPNVACRDGIEKPSAAKEGTDAAWCDLHLVGTRGDEPEGERFETTDDVSGIIFNPELSAHSAILKTICSNVNDYSL